MVAMTEEDFGAVRHLLPESVILLVQVVGWDAAFKLVRRFGGINLPVGMNKTRAGKMLHARLAEEVGETAADKISRVYGSQKFMWVPKCEAAMHELRNRKIRAELDRLTSRAVGCSMPEAVRTVAQQFGLTDRRIWYIAKETDIEPVEQAGLF